MAAVGLTVPARPSPPASVGVNSLPAHPASRMNAEETTGRIIVTSGGALGSELDLRQAELHVALVDDLEAGLGLGRHQPLELAHAGALDQEEGPLPAVAAHPGFQVLGVLVAAEDGPLVGRTLVDLVLGVEVLAAPVHLPDEQVFGGRAAQLVIVGDEPLL